MIVDALGMHIRWALVATMTLGLACGGAGESVGLDPAAPTTLAVGGLDQGGPGRKPAQPTTSRPETTTQPTTQARSFTMAFTGDLLLHERVNAMAARQAALQPDRAYDYRPLLAPIAPLIGSVDWAVCHLEVNLSADGTRLRPYPRFRAPGQIAFDARELGWDACTTASNHTLDHGAAGVTETLDVLDAAGLRAIGSARSAQEAADQVHLDIEGVRVAHLAYTYWFNGFEVPAEAPWTSAAIDEARILADTTAARAAGAEYVIVSLHWGEQYVNEPTAEQRELGPRLLASPDIDLIIGHHAHVVQPIDRVGDEWLVYGLGNLLSNSTQDVRRDELLVIVTVTETEAGSFDTDLEVVPLHLDYATLTVHSTAPSSGPATTDAALAASLAASHDRVLDVLSTGTAAPLPGLSGPS